MRWLVAFLVLLSSAFSFSIVEPFSAKVEENGTFYAGKVGPGQPLSISIIKKVSEGGRFGKGGYFDRAYVVDVPEGWKVRNSKVFDNPLQVRIIAPEDAPEGNYSFTILLEDQDNAELLGNKTFRVVVTLTKDVMDAALDKKIYRAGRDQPFRVMVTIRNKANVGDVFVVTSSIEGIVKTKEVFIPAGKVADVIYEFSLGDEDTYDGLVVVRSKHSEAISQELPFKVVVESSFLEDLGAVGRGVLLLYVPFQPVYDLTYLIYSLASGKQ